MKINNLKGNFNQAFKEVKGEIKGVTKLGEEEKVTPSAYAFADKTKVNEAKEQNIASTEVQKPASPAAQYDVATVIAFGTSINGSIKSEGAIKIFGEVTGDVSSNGDVTIDGAVDGNISGINVTTHHVEINGNITAGEKIEISSDSKVTGNLKGETVYVDGEIIGDVDVSGCLHLASNASINGNIKTSKITVDEGAVFCGEVKIGK